MSRVKHKLKAVHLKAREPGLLSDGGGLYLQITTGADQLIRRSWVVRIRSPRTGRVREMGLGSLDVLGLAAAREAADAAKKLAGAGVDPIEDRKSKKMAARLDAARCVTFGEAADHYVQAHRATWKNAKHIYQWESLRRQASALVDVPVQDIDVALVLKVLEPIWQVRVETARRLRARIESVLDSCTARGLRSGDNPARWRGHLQTLLPAPDKLRRVKHHPALPYQRVPAFMRLLKRSPSLSARALEVTILCATRTSETIEATWSEIDFERRIWTIGAERMKAGREHRIPLSDAALEIFQELRKLGSPKEKYVFAARRKDKPISNMAMAMLVRRLTKEKIVPHGFRSSFRQYVAEQCNLPNAGELGELALAHKNRDRVELAYQRSDLLDRRRDLMIAWSGHCRSAIHAVNAVDARKQESKRKIEVIRARGASN